MSDENVFGRRWVLTEDELLRMLWRCQAGENPDVVLVELHANHREDRRRRPHSFGGRSARNPRATRHIRRDRQQDGDSPRGR